MASGSRSHVSNVPSPLGNAAMAAVSLAAASPSAASSGVPRSGSATPNHLAFDGASSASQRRRSAELPAPPPQFSALSAALAAHSTAAAVLASSGVGSGAAGTEEHTPEPAVHTPQPTISVTAANEPPTVLLTRPTLSHPLEVPDVNLSAVSLASSTAGPEAARAYDELPSSPESMFSHRPLLVETPAVELPETPGFSLDAGAGGELVRQLQ